MKLGASIVAFSYAVISNAALADCQSFVGKAVNARDIDEVMRPFLALKPKGEFETSAEYNARRAPLISALPGELIIAKEPESRDYISYDADAGRLDVVTYAFRNEGLPTEVLFGPDAPYAGTVGPGVGAIDVAIKWSDVVQGRYLASNTYGATTSVSIILRHHRGIFDHSISSYTGEGLFPSAEQQPYIAGSVSMPPTVARRVKDKIKLAFSIQPKSPYFLTAVTKRASMASMDFPTEITHRVSVLVADIQCGLVLDPSNVVLGAFDTR